MGIFTDVAYSMGSELLFKCRHIFRSLKPQLLQNSSFFRKLFLCATFVFATPKPTVHKWQTTKIITVFTFLAGLLTRVRTHTHLLTEVEGHQMAFSLLYIPV